MSYKRLEAVTFWDCVDSLRQDDRYKGALVDTFLELRSDPYNSARLSTHKIGRALNGKDLFASDVGGRKSDRRVVWQMVNRTLVLLLYGTHKIYDRAKRMRIDFDDEQQRVVVYEKSPGTDRDQPHRGRQANGNRQEIPGRLFMAWTDEELRSFGFPDAAVTHLRRLNTDDELLEMEAELGAYCETAINLVAHGYPEVPNSEPVDRADDGPASRDTQQEQEKQEAPERQQTRDHGIGSHTAAPIVTQDDIELEARLADDHAGYWFTSSDPEFLAEVIGHPIEDWMIFLHPDQRSAVKRHYNGPARVRGAAGTGKTVIGLHRAAWLAERNRRDDQARQEQLPADSQPSLPVLFTTYVRSLPPVFESLYQRLVGTRHGGVEFVNVDKLARQMCWQAGERLNTAPREITNAYSRAYKRVVYPGTPLAEHRFSKPYLRDEITQVVKGRAVETLDEYLAIERTGRRAPMWRPQRAQVWELKEAWDAEMAARGTVDFCDVITKALHHARQLEAPRYSAVIVDEAQDLTLTGLKFLRALVNAPDHDVDRPNGLLILGDAAQRIYSGGFTLRQAGVEVRGRTTILTENYRNTNEIINTALAVASECQIDDLGERFRRGDAEVSALRRGPRPRLVHAIGLDAQVEEIVHLIGEFTTSEAGYGLGDIAVLAATNAKVKTICQLLDRHSIANQELGSYHGTTSPRVKVGTYFRAKGLEFKVVFLPQVTKDVFPRPRRRQSEDEYAETRDLDISRLFVAMTRARDLLVVLYDHQPSEIVAAAADLFEGLPDPS